MASNVENVKSDLDVLNRWWIANKLVINTSKTKQMNIKLSASNCDFSLNSCHLKLKPVCKYLGIYLHCKLLFISHIDVCEKWKTMWFNIKTKTLCTKVPTTGLLPQ